MLTVVQYVRKRAREEHLKRQYTPQQVADIIMKELEDESMV